MAWGRGGLSNERERVFPVRLTDTKLPTTPCTHLCLSPFAMAVSPGRSTMRVAIVRLPRGELSSPVFVCRAPRPPTYGAGAVTAATHQAANHSSAANCGHPAELRVCFHCPPFGTSPSGRPATPPSHSPVCPPPPLQRPPPRHRRAAPPIGRCALSVAGWPPVSPIIVVMTNTPGRWRSQDGRRAETPERPTNRVEPYPPPHSVRPARPQPCICYQPPRARKGTKGGGVGGGGRGGGWWRRLRRVLEERSQAEGRRAASGWTPRVACLPPSRRWQTQTGPMADARGRLGGAR